MIACLLWGLRIKYPYCWSARCNFSLPFMNVACKRALSGRTIIILFPLRENSTWHPFSWRGSSGLRICEKVAKVCEKHNRAATACWLSDRYSTFIHVALQWTIRYNMFGYIVMGMIFSFNTEVVIKTWTNTIII